MRSQPAIACRRQLANASIGDAPRALLMDLTLLLLMTVSSAGVGIPLPSPVLPRPSTRVFYSWQAGR